MKLKIIGAIVILLIAPRCYANPILDQSYFGPYRNFVYSGCCDAAQTFTVGLAGTLAQVSLDLYDLYPGLHGGPTLQILPTFSGVPSGNPLDVLATISLPEVSSSQLLAVDVSSFNIHVNVGDVLAIAIDASFDWIAGSDTLGPMYPGGMAYTRGLDQTVWSPIPSLDLGFQTFVSVPEPAAVWLLGLGMLGLIGYAPRKRVTT